MKLVLGTTIREHRNAQMDTKQSIPYLNATRLAMNCPFPDGMVWTQKLIGPDCHTAGSVPVEGPITTHVVIRVGIHPFLLQS